MASSSGFGGKAGAAVRAGHARTTSYIRPTSSRETALVLIVAIILARLLLTNQLQQFWSALWGPTKPLGSALPAKAGSSTTGSTKQ